MVNFYDILNINRNATNKDVRDSYIKIINVMKKTNASNDEIIRVKKAFQVLSEYHSRRSYDDMIDNKKISKPVISPNIDGFLRPNMRQNMLDDRMSDKFINAENEFKKMTRQFMNKKISNSNSYNFVQKKTSQGNKEDKKFYYDEQGKLNYK